MRRLILALLALGLIVGLAYAWWIDPIRITEAAPAQVTKDYQHAWIIMAAEALAQDGDWGRTRARLDTLRDPALPQTVKILFEQADTQGAKTTARALAQLADRLGVRTAEMSVYLITPVVTPASTLRTNTPTPPPTIRPTLTLATATATATPTSTPLATLSPVIPTPVPTYNPSYQIISQIAECTRANLTPQIRVTVQDVAGQPLAGVTVWITWDGGDDRFITGLKPEINAGFGDFDMLRDRNYNVSIDQPDAVIVSGLQAETCAGGGSVSWRLIIRQTAR